VIYQPIAPASRPPFGWVGLPASATPRGLLFCRLPGFLGLPADAPVVTLEPPVQAGQVLRFTRPTSTPLAQLPIGA
jgi:hypothetical protein